MALAGGGRDACGNARACCCYDHPHATPGSRLAVRQLAGVPESSSMIGNLRVRRLTSSCRAGDRSLPPHSARPSGGGRASPLPSGKLPSSLPLRQQDLSGITQRLFGLAAGRGCRRMHAAARSMKLTEREMSGVRWRPRSGCRSPAWSRTFRPGARRSRRR